MIKFNYGPIRNPETGETKDIVVKAKSPNNIKDILIGGGIITLGVIYLTVKAFENGADGYNEAEFDTLKDLGLIKDCE